MALYKWRKVRGNGKTGLRAIPVPSKASATSACRARKLFSRESYHRFWAYRGAYNILKSSIYRTRLLSSRVHCCFRWCEQMKMGAPRLFPCRRNEGYLLQKKNNVKFLIKTCTTTICEALLLYC